MDNEDRDDAQFASMMEQEAARPDLAPPPPGDDPLTPGDMLAATVESAKANVADAPPEPAPAVEFKAEDYLAQRDRVKDLERQIAEIQKQGKDAGKEAEAKAGLFEDPDAWEAELEKRADAKIQAKIDQFRADALNYDLAQTRTRVGDEKWAAMEKAVTETAARDPQFAASLKALSPYGAGQAIEKWYDSTEAVRDPEAYEKRLREKWEAERASDASNAAPAGQKPATGAAAAGENVVRLPPSLSRQAASRAATSGDDGDDSEAAIFAAGANPRRA